MPFVYRVPKSKFWQARFRDSSGKWRTTTTKLTGRGEALKVAEHLEEVAAGKRSVHHIRSVFNSLFKEFYNEKLPQATFNEFSAVWLEGLEPEVSVSTFEAYRKTAALFAGFLGDRAAGDIAEISRRDVIAFRNELAKTRSIDTTNNRLKVLRMLFKAAKRDEFVLENPAEFVDILKDRDGEGPGRRAFTIPEIRAVLKIADPEWQSLIKFGLYTGQRLGDLGRLTWANIDLEEDIIRLKAGKTDKRLSVPIAPPLRKHILALSSSENPLGPIHPRAFQTILETGRVVSLSNQFVELLAQSGLREVRDHQSRGIGREAKRERPGLSFHSLRHTAVSVLKAAGIPHATVQELIGHESEAVSRHYTHVDEGALKKAAEAFPKL
jgi:integrase